MKHVRKVLRSFPFGQDNARWAGAVEVVHRTSTREDGSKKEFIDLNLQIGGRYLGLPAHRLDDILDQLEEGREVALEENKKLMAIVNATRDKK